MPNISFTVPETHISVTRPIVLEIVKQVCEITKISRDIPIYFPDEVEAVAQKGSTLSDTNVKDNTRLTYDSNIQIVVKEAYNEGMILSTMVTKTENPPVFLDNDSLVLIRPVYSSTDVEISFKYSSNSKTNAERWVDDIRMRTSMMREINLHKVSYHYPLPDTFIKILAEIYKLRENDEFEPYNQSFSEYIQTYSSTRLTSVANQVGNNVSLAISETQTRIQGLFDFDIAPEKSTRDGQSTNWVANFVYKFRYDKPISVNMTYPVMISNQVIPITIVPAPPSIDYDNDKLSFSQSLNDLHKFEKNEIVNQYYLPAGLVKIPSFDEFIPSSTHTKIEMILTLLCSVDPSDRRMLFNLNDLDQFELDEDVLNFIKDVEWRYLSKPYMSILNLSVFRNFNLASHNQLQVSSNLDVKTTWDMSYRTPHRVALGLCIDITLLPNEALRRLYNHPSAAVKLLSAIKVKQSDLDAVKNRVDFSSIYQTNQPSQWNSMQDTTISHLTVVSGYVIAQRRD